MMANISIPAGQYPTLAHDGSYTFSGVLQKEFYKKDVDGQNIGISRKWNENTASKYTRDYLDRLLPTIKKHYGAEKPMHSYTDADFEEILEDLSTNLHYAESTTMHYRFLLWTVYRAGFESGLYPDNIFWGELIDPLEKPEEYEVHRANALTRIRKSFSIEEDIRLMHWFLSLNPTTASGPEIGLACMYFLGCRNNEACGANFDAFHSLDSHPKTAVFDMLTTTGINKNDLKAGGKSSNAPRVLPVPKLLYKFIVKRRNFLEEQIKQGLLVLPNGIDSVGKLPVVCTNSSYTTRAQTSDLSKAGRALFDNIGISKSELAVLHQILFSEEFKHTQIIEKDPTTYLFRRNVATRLFHCGFEWTTIQYWIAHEIEDVQKLRNHFNDEDTLALLGINYEKHPIFNIIFEKNQHQTVETCIISKNEALHIVITANEPGQKINIAVKSTPSPVKVTATELSAKENNDQIISVLNSMYKAYKSVYKKIAKQKSQN